MTYGIDDWYFARIFVLLSELQFDQSSSDKIKYKNICK